jgi:CRP-like cAMP-binding protein
MALLSDRTRNATIRARTVMNVLIIPKADFNKLRRSVPAFGDVFSELAKRRAVAGSPHSSVGPLHDREGRGTVVAVENFGHPDLLEPYWPPPLTH